MHVPLRAPLNAAVPSLGLVANDKVATPAASKHDAGTRGPGIWPDVVG